MMKDAADVISAYRAAYEAANDKPLYHVWYEMGWFRIRSEPHGHVIVKRRKEIEAMTDVLRRRSWK